MERRDRDRERYRDRDRRRYEDDYYRFDRDRDRDRDRRRDRDRSRSRRRSNSRSRYDRDRRKSRSRSSSRHRRSHRSRSRKETRDEKDCKRTPPPPPCITIVESVLPYPVCSKKEKNKEIALKDHVKQSSPDVISELEKHNKKPGAYFNLKPDEPIDKEKIHKEIEEKLRETLAREGIEYNAPKPEASHPVFANDGSFLEIFKKMQEAQQECAATEPQLQQASTSYAPPYMSVTSALPPRPQLPIFGRRRGGKILKTGVVAKPKTDNDSNTDPKDFWSIYLREVNKYKNAACDSDAQSRPLVK